MKNTLNLFCALSAALLLFACQKDETILYEEICMVDVLSPNLLQTDYGFTYNIVETMADPIPDTQKRLIIACDVLRQRSSDKDYDIRLLDYNTVLLKDPVLKSDPGDEPLGNDGINVTQAWAQGKYLNAQIQISAKSGSKMKHPVNLEFDDTRRNPDTLFFTFRHNGMDESLDNKSLPESSIYISQGYSSFPISQYFPADKQEMVLHIDWDWFIEAGGSLIREKEHHSTDIKFKK